MSKQTKISPSSADSVNGNYGDELRLNSLKGTRFALDTDKVKIIPVTAASGQGRSVETATSSIVHYKRHQITSLPSNFVTSSSSVQTPPGSSLFSNPYQGTDYKSVFDKHNIYCGWHK